MTSLAKKTALITGASRGIGEATARHFAEHGANVVLLARSKDDVDRIASEINAAGGSALALGCDVAWFHDVKSAVDIAQETFGSVDILINNAGLIDPIARITDSDPEEWGLILCRQGCRAGADPLRA